MEIGILSGVTSITFDLEIFNEYARLMLVLHQRQLKGNLVQFHSLIVI